MESRAGGLRGLVLCDAELAPARPDDALTGVLDPAAGSARHAVAALAGDLRTAPLLPLLVSGRGLRCAPEHAAALLDALRREAEGRFTLPAWSAEPDGALVSLASAGAEWTPRSWVELATRLLVHGTTGVLVSTRALLGEGWDCPSVNCLVDLGVAATGVSVQQARGRSLRLDPDDPQKLVLQLGHRLRGARPRPRERGLRALRAPPPAPVRSRRGRRDRGRPVARAPRAGPVRAARRRALRRRQPRHAGACRASRDEARERWRIGTPYRGAELRTVVVRPRRAPEPGAADAPAPMAAGLPIAQRAAAGRGRRRRPGRRGRGGRGGRPCAAGGPGAGAGRRRVGRAAPEPGARPAAARAAARPGGRRDRGRLRGAGRAVGGRRRLAGDRAACERLPPLRADRRHARGERPLLRGAGGAGRTRREPPLPGRASAAPSPASAPSRCSGAC